MPIVAVNGINVYYESTGSGEPLVFIPGLAGTTDLWLLQTPFFSQDYQVISLDNRGAGRSGMPAGPYSAAMMAQDLHALLDAIDVREPVNLVGASMGGLVAQAFIHAYPDRVKRLVLACTGVPVGDPHLTLPDSAVAARIANPGITPEEKINTYLEVFYHPDYVRRHPEIRTFFLSRKTPAQPAEAYMSQLAACGSSEPYYERLANIRVPVLVMHGDGDLIWPLQNAHMLKEGIGKHAELYIMPQAGHIFMHEQPEEFNRALAAFLKKPLPATS